MGVGSDTHIYQHGQKRRVDKVLCTNAVVKYVYRRYHQTYFSGQGYCVGPGPFPAQCSSLNVSAWYLFILPAFHGFSMCFVHVCKRVIEWLCADCIWAVTTGLVLITNFRSILFSAIARQQWCFTVCCARVRSLFVVIKENTSLWWFCIKLANLDDEWLSW